MQLQVVYSCVSPATDQATVSMCVMLSMPCVWICLILTQQVDCTMKTPTNVPCKYIAACLSKMKGRFRLEEGHILVMIGNERTVRDDDLHNVVPME